MIRKLWLKALGSGALAAGLLAGIQTAEAGPVKLAFDPAYGAPFDVSSYELGWRGEAIVDDGNCNVTGGGVSNFFGTCAGEFSFVSAKVEFYNATKDESGNTINDATIQTLNFFGGVVAGVERTSLTTATAVYSTPFNPVKGDGDIESSFLGHPAWFSLIFVGEFAQLFWFEEDPGIAVTSTLKGAPLGVNLFESLTYVACYFDKLGGGIWDGKPTILKDDCGISSSLKGAGAKLTITSAVPEPSSYALALAALGALAFSSRRRSRNLPSAS